MSAKKSPSNISPQDREVHKTKLVAMHAEFDERLNAAKAGADWRWRNERMPWLHNPGEFNGCSDRVNNYERLYGRRVGDLRVADIRAPGRHVRWTHEIFRIGSFEYFDPEPDPNKIEYVEYWDKDSCRWSTQITLSPFHHFTLARSMVQNHYTEGEDRAIGEIKH